MPFFAKEKRQPPPTFATDDVVPVHLFDGSSAARGILLAWTFKFDDVLDPIAIHDALTQLFQMDGWKKFSGRLRLRADGRLEIHVPERSTEARPAVFFSREDHDGPISEHPLASTLPRATGGIETFPGPRDFTPLALGPETPRTLDEFLYSDKPQFCLHIHTFTDSTIVGLTFTHISTDLGGFVALLDGWSNLLAKRPDAVAPLIGYRDDPFKGLSNPPTKQPHVLADKLLGGWRFKYWALQTSIETWRSVDVQARTVCIPGPLIKSLVSAAKKEADGGFITTGDILAAAACRTRARGLGAGSSREVMTMMALNPRGHAKSVFRPDAAYLGNSPANVYFSCPADKAQTLPLGQLALLVRKAISTQAAQEQLKANASLSVETMKKSDLPAIFGSKDMAAQFMSNWASGKIADRMDFSPAIVREAPTPRPLPNSKRGHPVYFSASDPAHNTVSGISSLYVVVGEDVDKNVWMTVTLPQDRWLDFMDLLRQHDGDGKVKARL